MDNETKVFLAQIIFFENQFASNYRFIDNDSGGIDIFDIEKDKMVANISLDIIKYFAEGLGRKLNKSF